MRIVTLEEHVTFPQLTAKIPADKLPPHGISQSPFVQRVSKLLAEVDGERLQSMDSNGISVQVLSVVGPGADLLDPTEGPRFALEYNNMLAAEIAKHPARFKAFAHLPISNPGAAADELERTAENYGFCGAMINGLTNGEFLDDEKYAPLLARAEKLQLPLYLHPGLPPKAVADAYYSGLPKLAGTVLSVSGWGWHSETAIHILRLIVSGTLDKFPGLKLIIGHMGEMLPMMMARCDEKFGTEKAGINQRSVSKTLHDQVYITTSGIFTKPPLQAAIDTFGIDNILFSVDYPFSPNEDGKQFLESLELSQTDMDKLTHSNADKLLKLS